MDQVEKLKQFVNDLESELKEVDSHEKLNEVKIKYTGRRSLLTEALRSIKELPKEDRGLVGKEANVAKVKIESLIATKETSLDKALEKEMLTENIDLTFPGKSKHIGKLHPITKKYNEIVKVFSELGFSIVEGPDIETDWHCFEMLRMPADHPARDMQDTFYIEEGEILPRTHTSSAQSRAMLNQKPPIKILVPGRCYRNEKPDPRHTETFYQFEGLVIDEKTSLKDMKATLTTAFRRLLGNNDIEIRFRHSHFPYTEPSLEVDATCISCQGKGCRICSKSGWVELCGAGMVHPEVLENFGINTDKYQGYAFGSGIERLVLLQSQLPDSRLLYENDIRTLAQF